jgi:hypothetical protein
MEGYAESHQTKAACTQISKDRHDLIDKTESGNQEFFVTTALSKVDLVDGLVNHCNDCEGAPR